jgi:hypothetical protein
MTIAPEAVQTAPAEPKAAVWEDFIDIFHAPTSVFRRRIIGRFGAALLILVVLLGIIMVTSKPFLDPVYEAEFARGAERALVENPELRNVPEEQRAVGQRFAGWFFVGGAVLGMPFIILLTGFGLWLVAMALGAQLSFGQAMMVVTYANVPRLLQQLLSAAQGAIMDPATLNSIHSIGTSPARFLDPDVVSPALIALASRFDLFTLWVTVLVAIGLSVAAGVSRAKGATGAIILWALATLVTAGMALG